MEIKDLLKDFQITKEKVSSERAEIISQFVEEINKERKDTKYKPVSGRSVAIQLSVLKTNFELYSWLSECRDYKKRNGSFSRIYYGALKKK